MADPYTLDFIWSKYTISPHPEIGMDSLHQTCSSLTKHVLLPSHISLLHGGFVLHPELVEVIQNVVPALGQLLYVALPHIGLYGAHTFAHDELRILGNLTGLLATQNQVILHWVLLLDKIYGAMMDLKATCYGHPVSTSQRPSRLGSFIESLPVKLRLKLPQALLVRFDVSSEDRLVERIQPTVSTPPLPLAASRVIAPKVVELGGQRRDVGQEPEGGKGFISLYDRIQQLKRERLANPKGDEKQPLQLACSTSSPLSPPSTLTSKTAFIPSAPISDEAVNVSSSRDSGSVWASALTPLIVASASEGVVVAKADDALISLDDTLKLHVHPCMNDDLDKCKNMSAESNEIQNGSSLTSNSSSPFAAPSHDAVEQHALVDTELRYRTARIPDTSAESGKRFNMEIRTTDGADSLCGALKGSFVERHEIADALTTQRKKKKTIVSIKSREQQKDLLLTSPSFASSFPPPQLGVKQVMDGILT
ncbi:hypothetical protein R3P38DRAFT_2775469 [Favolaschia claudopus]|uniref:Uncharacterized protein n=1 Tax=Favolaschia claudopus TaxID=2862362 RepID=A0AAW0BUZ8_9AGAR